MDGLQAGQTKIQHRNVDLGTVESLELTPDMSHVIVHARMTRASESHLTPNTRFAIIAPHVGVGGISGLSTLVSGSYIEMYPGKPSDESKRDFVGLDEPPVLPPDTKGRTFTLLANDLGSLTRGSPISYSGIKVGEVEDYQMRQDSKGVSVTAFVRSPYDGTGSSGNPLLERRRSGLDARRPGHAHPGQLLGTVALRWHRIRDTH